MKNHGKRRRELKRGHHQLKLNCKYCITDEVVLHPYFPFLNQCVTSILCFSVKAVQFSSIVIKQSFCICCSFSFASFAIWWSSWHFDKSLFKDKKEKNSVTIHFTEKHDFYFFFSVTYNMKLWKLEMQGKLKEIKALARRFFSCLN